MLLMAPQVPWHIATSTSPFVRISLDFNPGALTLSILRLGVARAPLSDRG
jgi:hypothetical protein